MRYLAALFLTSIFLLFGQVGSAAATTYACDTIPKTHPTLSLTTAEASIILTVANNQQRYVQFTCDQAFAISTFSSATLSDHTLVPANTPYTILTQSASETWYIMAQTTTGSFKVSVLANGR